LYVFTVPFSGGLLHCSRSAGLLTRVLRLVTGLRLRYVYIVCHAGRSYLTCTAVRFILRGLQFYTSHRSVRVPHAFTFSFTHHGSRLRYHARYTTFAHILFATPGSLCVSFISFCGYHAVYGSFSFTHYAFDFRLHYVHFRFSFSAVCVHKFSCITFGSTLFAFICCCSCTVCPIVTFGWLYVPTHIWFTGFCVYLVCAVYVPAFVVIYALLSAFGLVAFTARLRLDVTWFTRLHVHHTRSAAHVFVLGYTHTVAFISFISRLVCCALSFIRCVQHALVVYSLTSFGFTRWFYAFVCYTHTHYYSFTVYITFDIPVTHHGCLMLRFAARTRTPVRSFFQFAFAVTHTTPHRVHHLRLSLRLPFLRLFTVVGRLRCVYGSFTRRFRCTIRLPTVAVTTVPTTHFSTLPPLAHTRSRVYGFRF